MRVAKRQRGAPHRRLRGHTGKVNDLAVATLSDGGELLVSAGTDRVALVWDPVTGKQVSRLIGHEGAVLAVCSFAEADGTPCVVTGGEDGTLRLWDPRSGKPVAEPIRGDHEAVKELVAWHTGNQRRISAIVAIGQDHDAIVTFDTATREPIGPVLHATGGFSHLGLCRIDRQPVLVAQEVSGIPTIRLWDATTGRQLRQISLGDEDAEALTVLPVAPDRDLLAVATEEFVTLVDPTNGKFSDDSLAHDENQISALTWFRTGTGEIRLVSVISTVSDLWVAKFPSVTIWDPLRGEELGQFPTGYLGLIERVELPCGGEWVAVPCPDGSVRLWQLEKALAHRRGGTSGREGSGAPLHHVPEDTGQGLLLTTRDRQGLAEEDFLVDEQEYDLWDVTSRKHVGTLPELLVDAQVHVGPDGRAGVLTIDRHGDVARWDPREQFVDEVMHTDSEGYWLLNPEPRGTRLACLGDDPGVDVWDLATGELVATLGEAEPEGISWVLTGKGPRLAVCDLRDITLWDLDSGESRTLPMPPEVALTGLLIPGPGWFAVGDHEARLHVMDADSLEVITSLHTLGMIDAAVLPDGRLLTCTAQGGIDCWDPRTGEGLRHHDLGMGVRGVAALPDGALALGVLDGWVIVEPSEGWS